MKNKRVKLEPVNLDRLIDFVNTKIVQEDEMVDLLVEFRTFVRNLGNEDFAYKISKLFPKKIREIIEDEHCYFQ